MAAEEINYQSATRDVLLTLSKEIGASCIDVNLAFTKCKAQNSDPEACLKLGEGVLECGNKVLKQALTKCPDEFEEYRKCMDNTQINFGECRSQEKAFREAFAAQTRRLD